MNTLTMTYLPETGADGRARAIALANLSLTDATPTSVVEFVSRGRCVVVGAEADALNFVHELRGQLDCCVLVPDDAPPVVDKVQGTFVVRGGRPGIRGALGNFEITLFSAPTNRNLGTLVTPATERFDLVVDLGTPPLLRQAMLPLGYSAPGLDPIKRAALLGSLPQMQGEFEKPQYFNYNPEICAHGRSGKRGCTLCIDLCPAEAIVSIGGTVQVNPFLCQGGGACATACPSGAMTYAYPKASNLLEALRRLLRVYDESGGAAPGLLFHDASAAGTLEQVLAGNMPERLLPVAIEEIGSVGMETWLACFAFGAHAIVVLTSDATPPQVVDALQGQIATTKALLRGMGYAENRLGMVNSDQPAAAITALSALPVAPSRPANFAAPAGDKRGTLRLALMHLQAHAPDQALVTPLQTGAPFGEVMVDAAACTLCMSCVSACPTHALLDGRGLPQLQFREWNCVQCGLCERTCPENAITLNPRFLHQSEERERPRVLHEEPPVCCVSCGKPFATRKMLDKLTSKLAGHWMFQTDEARRRVQMCGDCRVRDLFTAEAHRQDG